MICNLQWIVILIGILLSIIAVFVSNIVFLFSVSPILLILFIIVVVVGIRAFKEWENEFEFSTLFGIGAVLSLVSVLILEIFCWDSVIIPVLSRAVPFYTERIVSYAQGDGKILMAIILTIEEPIIVGILFPVVFEGVLWIYQFVKDFIQGIRQEKFKKTYFDVCLKYVLNSSQPVSKNGILNAIPIGNKKYKLGDALLYALQRRTYFDSEKNLYWGKKYYDQMKKLIEDTLLNTSPKPLEWLLNNLPGYVSDEYTSFKVTAIRELVSEKVFVLETKTGSNLNEDSEETILYRHCRGSKIKTVVIEDDPDFY